MNPKTKEVERRCYVFYCESDPLNVVNTISLAFKLREEQSRVGVPPPPTHIPNLSPRSDALDCPTPTIQPQDDPDATPRATSSSMNTFRMPSVDAPANPLITIKRPDMLNESCENPNSSKTVQNTKSQVPIPGPRFKSPNIAVEPSTPITPDGCIYEELNLPQKIDPNKEDPKDTKGMSFIGKPYNHPRRSRSSSPNDGFTIPQMFKNAQPEETPNSTEPKSKILNFFKDKVYDSLCLILRSTF